MSARFKHIRVTSDPQTSGIRTITFDKVQRKNAIGLQDYMDITQAFAEAANDPSVKLLIITGGGDYYSSGTDMSAFADPESLDPDGMDGKIQRAGQVLQEFVAAFIDFPKILVALVNGPAIGIAATTLALCDLVYALDEAAFVSTPFAKLALSPEGCSTYTFPRLMGPGRATETLTLGRRLSAKEAETAGLYTRLYTGPGARDEAMGELKMLAALPMSAILSNKRQLRQWDSAALHAANASEVAELKKAWKSDDFFNTVAQFLMRKSSSQNDSKL